MKLQVLALVLVGFAPPIRAAQVTAGWRMQVEMFAPGFPESSNLRKFDKPPAESAFFQPGDELWDVSKLGEWPYASEAGKAPEDPFGVASTPANMEAWQGEWIVWNARSGMFIARGSYNDISAAELGLGFREQAGVICSTFELESAGQPLRSLSLVLRSGAEAKMQTAEMDLVVSAVASDEGGLADLTASVSWQAGEGGSRWQFAGAACIRDDSRHLLASQGSGHSAWKLYVTTRYERMGGIPRSQARWMEAAGKLRPWAMRLPPMPSFRKPLGDGREAAYLPTIADLILLPQHGLELPVVDVPEALKDVAEGPVIDLRDWLKPRGVNPSQLGFFAGLDLLSSRVLVIGDAQAVDRCEDLFSTVLDDRPVASLRISTNEAAGGWAVSARSGERVRLARVDASGKEELLFEVEPTLGGDSRIVDLRMKADMVSGDGSQVRVDSVALLQMGKPMEVARRATPEGGEVVMEVTATMVPFKP